MDLLVKILPIEDIIELFIIFFFSFIGSIATDYLKILKFSSKSEFNFIEIFLSTFTASLMIFSITDYIDGILNIKIVMFLSFLSGLVGFELLKRISTIKGIFRFLKDIVDLYNRKYSDNKE